jgi:sugar phosphate permease
MSTIAPSAADDDAPRLYRRITLRLLPFLTLCYLFAFLDRINIGFAKLQMQDALGLSDAAYGIGAGIFFIGYVLFEIPSNLLLPRFGARRTLSRIMVLWGLTSASMIFVRNAHTFYAMRFLLGVFEAGFAPGMILYLTWWYPPARMGRVMAFVMAAGPLGGVIGGPLSTAVMTSLAGMHGLAGWQWMFIIEGLPCAVFGAIAWWWLDDRPQDAAWLSDSDKARLATDLRSDAAQPASMPFWRIVANRTVLGIAFSNFCVIAGIYTVSFWLPSLLKSIGVHTALQFGLYTALPYAASLVAMVCLALSSDRLRERRWHSAGCSFVAGGALLVTAYATSGMTVALVSLTLATAMAWASYTVLWAIPGEYLKGPAAPGGIAFINVAGVLGGFVSPIVIGVLSTATGSLRSGLLPMVALLVAGGIAMVVTRIPRRGIPAIGVQAP